MLGWKPQLPQYVSLSLDTVHLNVPEGHKKGSEKQPWEPLGHDL